VLYSRMLTSPSALAAGGCGALRGAPEIDERNLVDAADGAVGRTAFSVRNSRLRSPCVVGERDARVAALLRAVVDEPFSQM